MSNTPPAAPTYDRFRRRVRWLPLAVPFVYLALVFSVQPADRFGPPPEWSWLGRAAYDDVDDVAFAMRGLNAALGRAPGRSTEPPYMYDLEERDRYGEALSTDRPFEPAYFLEYPHLMLVLFRLPYWAGVRVPDPPSGLLDGSHVNAAFHAPRDGREVDIWTGLRRSVQYYQAVMAACLTLVMITVGLGYLADGSLAGSCWLFVLPGTLYFSLWRYDVVPALLVALSLAALGRERPGLAGLCLGLATMVKVYPVLIMPLFLRWLLPDLRATTRCAVTFAATCAAVLVPAVWLYGIDGTLGPYRFQLGRPPEFGWIMYGHVLPQWLADPKGVGPLFRSGCVILTVLGLCLTRPEGLDGLLRRGAIILMVFANLQVFYSPQWVVWLTPFLVPLATRSVGVFRYAVALDLLTYFIFPFCMDQMLHGGSLPRRTTIARAVLTLGLIGVLLAQEFRWPWRREGWKAMSGQKTAAAG